MSETARGVTLTVNADTAQAIQKLNTFFNGAAAGFERLVKTGAGFAAVLLGLRGIESIGHQVLKLGSDLENLRRQTGGAISDLVILRRQLTEAGGSAESAGMMLLFMQRSIANAAEEGGAAAKTFSDLKLSVSVAQLSAMSATDQYKLLGAAIAAIENPAKRTEAILKVFGRGGGDLATVFSDPQKFAAAFSGPNLFGQVMARSAEGFHEIEQALIRLAANGKRIMAGFLDQIVPAFKEAIEQLGHIDLTAVGIRLGSFVRVVINSWKEDRFPEMIGLLIEAGFEIGVDAAILQWKGLLKTLEFLTGAQGGAIWTALLNGVMTFGVKALEFVLTNVFRPMFGFFGGVWDYLFDQLRVGFQRFGNFMKQVFADAINFFISGYNNVASKLGLGAVRPVTANVGEVEPAVSFGGAVGRNMGAATDVIQDITGKLNEQLEAARSVLGITEKITGQDNKRLSALERLKMLLDEQIKAHEREAKIEPGRGGSPINSVLQRLRETERLQKEKLLVLDRQMADVETDFTKTAAAKFSEKKRIYEEERAALDAIVKALRERAKLEDPTTAEQTLTRADSFEKQGNEAYKSERGLGADPNSYGDQFRKTFKDLRDEFGTFAESLAKTFKDVFDSAIGSISNGITGLIEGTTTWAQVLRNIGENLLGTVVQGIVRMFAEWVLGTEATKSAELASQAATLPGALVKMLATAVGEGGWAAVALIAAAVAAMGLGIAYAAGAFESGGYTGSGGHHEVAGVVHRGEYVLNADATSRIGVPTLNAMNAGRPAGASSRSGGRAGGNGERGIQLFFYDNRHDIPTYFHNPSYQQAVVDVVKKNWHQFS
jgi:hypothetical protein